MRIHYIQHVPFEDPACLFAWAKQRRYEMTGTRVYRSFSFPDPSAFDALVIMGGPMGVYDNHYPWMTPEKKWIESVIGTAKPVLGICLGAQLLADVLGARVYPNVHREIGWFPIRKTEPGKKSALLGGLPDTLTAFHWHGDTFDIPDGAVHLMESDAAPHQAFQAGAILGLQFHLEVTSESIARLIRHGAEDLKPGSFVQHKTELIVNTGSYLPSLHRHCRTLLDQWLLMFTGDPDHD